MNALHQISDAPRVAIHQYEKRRFQRVSVTLLGRYMLANREEFPCQTMDVSPGGALLNAPVCGIIGERVIVYLEHLGRVEGGITRHIEGGFAFSISAPARKRDKIASQLTWLANRHALGLPEDRRHERVVPLKAAAVLRCESGREILVRIIDVSMSGAALNCDTTLPVGTAVTIGSTSARIVRHFTGGIGVEFPLPLSPDKLDDRIVL